MPTYSSWNDVPVGEQLVLLALKDQWEQETGYRYALNPGDLTNLAMRGAETGADIGAYVVAQEADFFTSGPAAGMPWGEFGVSKDTYQSLATTFGSEFKKLTGQDIPTDKLAQAFKTSQTGAGGLLTGSEYAQQLLNDAEIQKTYGWIKYGMDYNQFQQQKLGMQQAFGKQLGDSEAIAQLQYFHSNQGSDRSARAQTAQPGSQKAQTAGEGQSEVR